LAKNALGYVNFGPGSGGVFPRAEIERTERTIPRQAEQAKLMESIIDQDTDAKRRIQLEYEAKSLKESTEQYKVRLERLHERETQLSIQLRSEQASLAELEGRLDLLEREIEIEIDKLRNEPGIQKEKSQ
jgi:predicted  nucleic acid-binding Zn-ribbon protein